jgi:hypothetical protein
LGFLIPARSNDGRGYELGADVRFGEGLFVHEEFFATGSRETPLRRINWIEPR